MTGRVITPLIMLIVNVILGSVGQVMMKIGATRMGSVHESHGIVGGLLNTFINIFTNLHVLGGLSLYALSAVIWIRILRQVNLSLAYPMMSLSYVAVVILSALLLNEKVSAITIIGLIFITIGVSLIGLGYGVNK